MKDIDYIPQDDEMEELRRRILECRPTAGESLRHANEELMPLFIYNSINIAGDRISRVNTIKTLKTADDLAEPALKAANEILGLRDAYQKLLAIAAQPAVSVQDVAELHRLYYLRIDDTSAGHCRPDTEKRNYEAELIEFLDWLNSTHDTDCFHTSATAYRRYIYMHPFKGGNGHLARMVLMLTMHKYGYPAIVIPNKWKAEYDALIKNYDEASFADFLKKCAFSTMNTIAANLGSNYSDRKTRHIRGINPDDEILAHIRQNPGVKAIDMKKNFPKISYTKMTRILRTLREDGKIEFKGATKTGGYFAID